jgi:WD40 repeat protein
MQKLTYDEEALAVDLGPRWSLGQFETWVMAASPREEDVAVLADRGLVQLVRGEEDALVKLNEWEFGGGVHSLQWLKKLLVATPRLTTLLDPETAERAYSLELEGVCKAASDPHHESLTVLGVDCSVSVWDCREQSVSFSIRSAHKDSVLDLDFNPNNPYHIVSSSKDCTVRFWDIRKPSTCLKLLAEHAHWVWGVKFNPFHDQLLLTCSSDNSSMLHRVVTASSTPMNESFFEKESDAVLKRHAEFDDSVYCCAWSAAEAWVYANVSYSGKVSVSQVPSEEKYKILL